MTHAVPGRASMYRQVAELNARIDRLPGFGLSPGFFVLVGASYFFTYYDITVIGGTLPVVATQFHLTSGQTALPVSMNLAGYIVGAYGLATIADYVGRRRALALSCVVLAVGAVLTAFSWDYASFVIFRTLTGIGMGAQISLAATLMTELAPSRLRGRGIATNVFWGACGLGGAPWIVLELLKLGSIGWRLSFGFGAVVVLVLFFLNDTYVPESPRWLVLHGHADEAEETTRRLEQACVAKGLTLPDPPPVPDEEPLQTFPLMELFRPPYLYRVLVVFCFWFLAYMAAYAYLAYQPTLLNGLHVGAPHGLLFSAIGDVSFPVGAAIAIWLIDKYDRKFLAVGAGAVGMIGLLLIATAQGPTMIIIGSFVAGLWILSPAYGYAYTAEVFPTRIRATGMSLGDGAGHGGAVVQPYIIVALLAAYSARFALWMIIAMIACSILVMLVGGMRTTGRHLTNMSGTEEGELTGVSGG